jgi:hypothetical protein
MIIKTEKKGDVTIYTVDKDFDDKAAANNYEKILEEVSSLDLVKKAEKGSYYVGMGGKMAGLQIVVDKKKLLELSN